MEENGKYGDTRPNQSNGIKSTNRKLYQCLREASIFVKRMPKKYLRHTHTNCMSLLRLNPAFTITWIIVRTNVTSASSLTPRARCVRAADCVNPPLDCSMLPASS